MRRNKKISAILLVIIFVLTLLPISAFAEYRYESLQYNKWYKLQDLWGTMTIYKVKVSTDTVMMINWKNYNSEDNWGYGAFYTDRECDYSIGDSFLGFEKQSTGTKGVVLYPGTYFLRMYDGKEKAQIRITKKTVKSMNKSNYCLQNAITLKAKKKAEFAQTRKNNYYRWYKIKLKKTQTVSIVGNIDWYDLYDSNFNEIHCSRTGDDVIKTDGMQSPGTYYLVLYDYISSLIRAGKYYRVYWE